MAFTTVTLAASLDALSASKLGLPAQDFRPGDQITISDGDARSLLAAGYVGASSPVSAIPMLAGPNTWTGTQDFTGATVTGIAGGTGGSGPPLGGPNTWTGTQNFTGATTPGLARTAGGNTWTGTQNFTGATVTGISGGGAAAAKAWEFLVETYGAKGDGTTDDSAAIQAAIDAAFAYANSSGTFYAEVVFQPRTYLIAGPYQTQYYGNAQIAIPYQTMKSRKVTLVLRGGMEASAFPIWTQTASARNGAVLRSTGAGGAPDATNGDFAVVGGQSWQRGFGLSGGQALVGPETGDYNVWNNIMLRVDGISVVVPSPANQMGFQFQALAEVSIGSASAYSDAAPSGSGAAGYVQSTNARAIGLAMPSDYNNADNMIQNYACEGFYIGLFLGEHTVANNIRFLYCHIAVYVGNTAHYSIVTYAVIESCTVGIHTEGHADFLMADFEDSSAAGGLFDTQYFVEAGGSAMGTVRYFTMDANSKMIPPNLLSINQFSGVRVLDGRQAPGYRDDKPAMPASTQYLLNPYYRDVSVVITGGTVSKVEVWTPGPTATYRTVATATNTNTIVPTGGYIRLTYTVAPTWEWCLTSATL